MHLSRSRDAVRVYAMVLFAAWEGHGWGKRSSQGETFEIQPVAPPPTKRRGRTVYVDIARGPAWRQTTPGMKWFAADTGAAPCRNRRCVWVWRETLRCSICWRAGL